jgi:hypothetical protein
MDLLKWTAAALILVTILYGGVVAFGAWRWQEVTRVLVARLNAAETSHGTLRVDCH